MRRLTKITLLIIIMTLTTATASADKYSRAWKKVENYIKEDLPESAAKEINNIWDMAAKDRDGRQMLKSAVYLTQVQQTYGENSVRDGIELFSSLLPKLRVQEHKALCHAFLAKGYIRYWNNNRYNISSRNYTTDEVNPPLEHWTAKMICDTICYHLEQSMKLAGDVASGYYEEFFPGGNKAGQKLRPRLMDMLMDDAMILITDYRFTIGKTKFLDDSRLYGDMQDYLDATEGLTADDPDFWMFYVLRCLTLHNTDSKPDIRCTIDIRRMRTLNSYLENNGSWSKNHDEWLKGCVSLARSYAKKVKFSTMLYSMAARKIVDDLYAFSDEKAPLMMRQAHDICIEAGKKWPKSEGAFECYAIKDEIERRDVKFEFQQDFLPGERNIARLDYKNVNTVYLKVVEVPGQLKANDQVTLLSQLAQCSTVAEWSMRVNDPGDYLEHYTMINISPVMQGCYYMLASSGPYFGSGDCIAYQYIECNGIQFVKLIQNNGTLYGTAVDTRTGRPIPDCKYTVWRVNYEGDQVKMMTSGITAADGTVVVEGLKNDRYKIELEGAGSRGNATFNIPWRSDMPERQYARLFTDRYTYLPGDSVQYFGVVYTKDSEKGKVLRGVKVEISVLGNGFDKVIDTLVTDSMGAFKGSFKIPDNYRPGSLTLSVSEDEDEDIYSFGGYASVNVESFRQPKFEVNIDRCTDEVYYDVPVTITGKAVSYTGVPIDSASVQWYAGVNSYLCHRFCVLDERGRVRVGAGNITTGADGSFSFSVTVPAEIMLQTNGIVNVNVTVTDVNGETHEALSVFDVSQKPRRYIDIASRNDVIDSNGQKSLFFTLNSNNGPVSGRINVKVSRLTWLEKPGLPLPFNTFSDNTSHPRYATELAENVFNMNLKERFPLYDFDFKGDDIVESVVFEGVVPFDKDDNSSRELILDALQSGVYRITANADGCAEETEEFILCREDDYDFVPLKPLLWAFDTRGASQRVEVGDTARIRLGNSRKGTIIHYIIENKYGVYERGMLESNGRQQVLSIPVTKELTGYFSVNCCVLYEGVGENLSFTFEVPDRDSQLKMELVTFRSLLEPDVDEEWNIRITDWHGNPVRAAILMDMYDRALNMYGTHNIWFQPFSATHVYGRTLLETPLNYVHQYLSWEHTFGSDYEYKGKRAITGTLLDPFQYIFIRFNGSRSQMHLRGYAAKSANELPEVDIVADRMVETSGLAIPLREVSSVSYDEEALQGGVAGLDVVFNSGDLIAESHIELQDAAREQEKIALRSDLNTTGLFEYLLTDDDGMATVRFRAPQLLTMWNIKGLSYTDSLSTGRIDTTLTTRKLIMVEPSSPRFLREGDRMEFTVKVSNMTETAFKAAVTMTLTDAVTGKALNIIEGGYKKNVNVPAGGSAGTSFTIKVPKGLTAVTYRLTAQTTGHSDGMMETIPVLSNRTQVVQSLSLFNNGKEKRSFRFEVLDKPRSTTMADEQLTLEYSATPIWYAIQSLPIMIRVDDPSNLRLFHSMMGAAISQDLCKRYPVIREMLDEWTQLPASAWQTQLEKNEKLTGTLLEETPWLWSSNNERDRLRTLATQLGAEETARAFDDALEKIIDAQSSDGGWPWIEGLPSSLHITDEILQGLGLLIENGIIEVTPELKDMLQKALDYMDAAFYKEYDVDRKPQSLGYSELSYLLTRSYYNGYPFKGLTKSSHTYFSRLAEVEDTHNLSLYFRSQLALLMARNGKLEQARHIAATLLERSLYNDEMGRYWRDNAGGLLWYEAPIETQALIIRTLLAVGREKEAVEAARWLLKQKQTTGWGSSPATAAAVTALMAAGGKAQLESDPDITIYVGKDAIQASTSKATAGYTTQTWHGPISRDKANITVDAKTPGISWGAVYRTFTEELDKVEHHENGMSLKRTMWRVIHGADGDRLEEVKPGTVLHVGDRIRIKFELDTDRNLEYLQLADMRAATFEPVSTRGGYTYNWRDDIGYYAAPGNTRNVFYIDRLSKGSYSIEYEVKVQKPGRFTVGNAVMQCLYAPAFRATTTSAVITVE